MEIVKNHFIKAEKVESFAQIKDVAFQMVEKLNAGLMSNGIVVSGHGLAHNQVEDKQPLSFFVLSDKTLREQNWPSQFIINPEIIEPERTITIGEDEHGAPDTRSNIKTYPEGCFSFPHKAPKNVERYYQIRVVYYVPGETEGLFKRKRKGLVRMEETLEGLKAHIYQHEWQHTKGENIYYKK